MENVWTILKSGWRISKSRPLVPKTSTLPLSYIPYCKTKPKFYQVGEEGIEPPRLKNHSSFTDWYYVANSRHPPIQFIFNDRTDGRWGGWDSNPRCYYLWLKARSVRRYGNRPIKGLNCQCAWWSLNHSLRIPRRPLPVKWCVPVPKVVLSIWGLVPPPIYLDYHRSDHCG